MRCECCNTEFKTEQKIHAYISREHPYFIQPTNDKIQECTKCDLKTPVLFTGLLGTVQYRLVVRLFFFSVMNKKIQRTDEQTKEIVDSKTGGESFVCHQRKKAYNCSCCNFQTNFMRSFTVHERTHPSNLTQFEYINIKGENVDENVNQSSTNNVDSSSYFDTHLMNTSETSVINRGYQIYDSETSKCCCFSC
nr:unnamed protein product [Callosobruchus analis]